MSEWYLQANPGIIEPSWARRAWDLQADFNRMMSLQIETIEAMWVIQCLQLEFDGLGIA